MRSARAALAALTLAVLSCASAQDKVPVLEGKTLAVFDAPDAIQGVAVDAGHFYAIDNFRITKHDKASGKPVAQWDGVRKEGPVIHLDSGVVLDGRLYAAHSNWPLWPMTSSVEVWDARSMAHVASYSFGIRIGSFTWLDRHGGFWWGTFANYNRIQPGAQAPYGYTMNTQMVKMDDRFQVLEAWTYPAVLLAKFETMSNSGGSWGPDGRLYITGHDHAEAYVMELPSAGSVLRWVATVKLPDIEGQGIAWDRSTSEPVLYGIRRSKKQVVRMSVPLQSGEPRRERIGVVKQFPAQ
jgi:hypothetical protein